MSDDVHKQRMNDLESQLAFQEDIIEQLNQQVYDQSQQLTELQQHVRFLAKKLKQIQEDNSSAGVDPSHEPPPPHY